MVTVNGFGTIIYGHAREEQLTDEQRLQAEQAGFRPVTYQVVKWFAVFFLPFVPVGCYRVMATQGFWSLRPAQYAMRPVAWDWGQVARHYLIAYGPLVGFVYWVLA
jgi:hypothetical protein